MSVHVAYEKCCSRGVRASLFMCIFPVCQRVAHKYSIHLNKKIASLLHMS